MAVTQQPITIISARADGATTLSLALAAVLGARDRTALLDLNMLNSEVASFLDLDESSTVYHLAYNAQLGPITDEELRGHLQWHDGFALLPGIVDPFHREQVGQHFVGSLVAAVQRQFTSVVVDAGRADVSLPPVLAAGTVLWVVAPRPVGMAAFDRAYRVLDSTNSRWVDRVKVVLNRVSAETFAEVPGFIAAEYGLQVLAEVAECPRFWSRAELDHSLRALTGPVGDRRRFVLAYGEEALRVRTDLEVLVERLTTSLTVTRR
jgi:Flp pilus assembly CpaE family ATPase